MPADDRDQQQCGDLAPRIIDASTLKLSTVLEPISATNDLLCQAGVYTRRRRYSLAPDPHWKEPNHGSGYLRKLHGAARGRAQIGLSGVGCGEFSEANPRIGRGNSREPNFPAKTAGGPSGIRTRGPVEESLALKTRQNFALQSQNWAPEKISRRSCCGSVVHLSQRAHGLNTCELSHIRTGLLRRRERSCWRRWLRRKHCANGRERLASMAGLWVVGAPRMGRGCATGEPPNGQILSR